MTNYIILIFMFGAILMSCQDEKIPVPDESSEDIDTNSITYLALGDSYTIGERVSDTARFPYLLSRELIKQGYNVSKTNIIATTGWTTQNLLDGISSSLGKDERYHIVSLLIGVNNFYQRRSIEEYKSQFTTLALKSIEIANGDKNKVFILSIPDYGYTPFGRATQQKISEGIDKFNEINKCISDSLGLKYFDITPISRQGLEKPELVASDGLHPSGIMYQEWVDLILPGVLSMVK